MVLVYGRLNCPDPSKGFQSALVAVLDIQCHSDKNSLVAAWRITAPTPNSFQMH